MTKRGAAWIFPVLIGVSLLVHGALLRWAKLSSSPPQAAVASDLTSVTFILEEPVPLSPEPEPPVEPPPPEPQETPEPIQEEVLATEPDIEPPQPVAPPTPPSTPRPTPRPQPPLPKPVSKPSRPQSSTPAPPTPRSITIAKPDYARNPPPRYPEMARQKGWEGRSMIRATVNAAGKVTAVSLQQSSGFGVLDQAALQAVRGWKFIPRKENGIPQDSVVEVPVNFNLRQK